MNPSERAPSYSGENGSNAEDTALIRRIVDADETALGALYDRWVRSLYSLVLHLLKDPDEAEDVVEETFWQAWRKADSYEPSKGAVSTWLLTIGRRKALDRLRARKRNREDPIQDERGFSDLRSTSPDPGSEAEGSELREHVRAALRELPEEQREALHLVAVEDLSYHEAAEILDIPVGTLMSRVSRARASLRDFENGTKKPNHLRLVGGDND